MAGRTKRPPLALLVPIGVAVVTVAIVGLLATLPDRPYPRPVWVLLHLPGLTFTVFGLVAWRRRPANGTGRLMVLVGATWYLGDLQASHQPVLFALGFLLFHVNQVALGHMALALPTGRLTRLDERLNIGAQYVATLLIQALPYLTEKSVTAEIWGQVAAPDFWAPIGSTLVLAFTALTAAQIVRRWRAAGRPTRREYALVWGTMLAIGVLILVTAVAFLARAPWIVKQCLFFGYVIGLTVTPAAIVAGLLWVNIVRLRVADLVLALQRPVEPVTLRALLAEALGDPTLDVVFPTPAGDGYVDVDGHPVPEPVADGRRAVTPVLREGRPLAVLVHDPGLLGQRSVVDAVVAAARLALDNARLYADLRAQLEQVRASRARVVRAADAERRRIQRDLHDGVQHKLLATSILVQRARPASEELLGPAAVQLAEVIRELRELTNGIYPPALAEQGLAAAVEALAEHAPLPVATDVTPDRFPESVEHSAYFLVSEALANVYKHAGAGRARVRVARRDRVLVVEVADDGVGGVGTPPRGLEDRTASVRGTLSVDSPRGAGTRITVELPCA